MFERQSEHVVCITAIALVLGISNFDRKMHTEIENHNSRIDKNPDADSL